MIYLSSMSIAHLFEYLFVCSFHFKDLKWESFLINQSNAYMIAAIVSWLEYYLEFRLVPSVMQQSSLFVGLIIVTIGHYCRIAAMFTA